MLVSIRHPVPVRWRPSRGRSSRVSLQVATTPVEIPEVPEGTLERRPGSYSLRGSQTPFLIHGGRCFRAVQPWMLNGGRDVAGDAFATPAMVARALSQEDARGISFVLPGSPLQARSSSRDIPSYGEELPASVLANAVSDLTVPVRAALVEHVRRNLVTDGVRVYAQRDLPMIAPHAWRDKYVPNGPVTTLEEGPVFEPARYHLVRAYQEAIKYRGAALARVKGSFSKVEEMEAAFGKLPYVGADIALYVNAGPGTFQRLYGMVQANAATMGADITHLGTHVERLSPYADLGLVGAIPKDSHAEVVGLMGDALDALQAALPHGYQPILPRWLKAYSDTVMRPSFPAPAVPDEDIDTLSALGPAP